MRRGTFLSLLDSDLSNDDDKMALTKFMTKASARGHSTRMTTRNRAPQPPEDSEDPSNPEDDTTDDNDSLMASKSNDSGGGGAGGGDGDGDNGDSNDPDYNFNEGQWSKMADLFISLGMSKLTKSK